MPFQHGSFPAPLYFAPKKTCKLNLLKLRRATVSTCCSFRTILHNYLETSRKKIRTETFTKNTTSKCDWLELKTVQRIISSCGENGWKWLFSPFTVFNFGFAAFASLGKSFAQQRHVITKWAVFLEHPYCWNMGRSKNCKTIFLGTP